MALKDCTYKEDSDMTDPSARLPVGNERFLHFNQYAHQHTHPCVLTADFETFQKKSELGKKGMKQEHVNTLNEVASFSFYVEAPLIPQLHGLKVLKKGNAAEFLVEVDK